MHDRDGWIWYDGALVPWRNATTHVLTHSLHYGVAAIEGLRAYASERGPRLFRLREHTERLIASARIYGMAIPFSVEELMTAQCAVVRENHLPSAYVRPIAFYGPEKMGLAPVGAQVHVAIAAWPWCSHLGPEPAERGLRVKTSSFSRNAISATLPRAKISASYANNILAQQEAAADGYDEALLLDGAGFVCEGSSENLIMVRHGRLYEPEPTSALHGITRDTLITLARELGYSVEARRLTRDDVYTADEAFFCGTAAEVLPSWSSIGERSAPGHPDLSRENCTQPSSKPRWARHTCPGSIRAQNCHEGTPFSAELARNFVRYVQPGSAYPTPLIVSAPLSTLS